MNKVTDKKAGMAKARHHRAIRRTINPSKRLEQTKESRCECLTALPGTVDVSALAQLYNSPPTSRIAREDLLDEARTALMKYELAESDREIAADSLARAMHMLLEQHGLKKLEPEHMAELERHVLVWHGLCQPANVANRAEVDNRSSTPDRHRSRRKIEKKVLSESPDPQARNRGWG